MKIFRNISTTLKKRSTTLALLATAVLSSGAFAQSSEPITIQSPFDYADVATTVAAAAATVLALTFGYMVAFRLVKRIIGRLAGQA
ncbi:MAG: hypothetical protein QF704_10460 [Anaerolineales bacterium]|jgi:hypothetical protein|nr:hypothetical protein [Anaerolineales bacterium]